MQPIEVANYPGFYLIPGHPNYAISKVGNTVIDRNGTPTIVNASQQYMYTCFDGESHHIHRLKAETFIERPEWIPPGTSLVVNHLDGKTHHNELDNIEWTTYAGNILHAYRTGLRNDNIPVVLRDLESGCVSDHYSLTECARQIGINPSYVSRYLDSSRDAPLMWKYVVIRKGEPWPFLNQSHIGSRAKSTPMPVTITNLETGERKSYMSLTYGARDLNIKPGTLAMHLHRNKDKPFRGYSVKPVTDITVLQGLMQTDPEHLKRQESMRSRTPTRKKLVG